VTGTTGGLGGLLTKAGQLLGNTATNTGTSLSATGATGATGTTAPAGVS
jgi:hypothetical protein